MKQLALVLACSGLASVVEAHIPVVTTSEASMPVTGSYLGRGDISRAVFSDLVGRGEIDFHTFSIAEPLTGHVQLFTPVCKHIPFYRSFQPTAVLLKGEAPLPEVYPPDEAYRAKLEALAVATAASAIPADQRQIFTDHGISYWIGGAVRIDLEPGLYTVAVFDPRGQSGNYVLGLQDRELWTVAVRGYADAALKQVATGHCSPRGFSGRLHLDRRARS